jgi:hypothetical protein
MLDCDFSSGGLVLRRQFWCCSWLVAVGVVVLAVFVAHCIFGWWLTDLVMRGSRHCRLCGGDV